MTTEKKSTTTKKSQAAKTKETAPKSTPAKTAMVTVNVEETTLANRTPDVIATEIRDIDQKARQHAIRSAIEIGEKLIEAKALVKHGDWANWLKENVNYSQSTANNFMRVATEYKELNSQALANLSYSQAVALLSVKAEEREAFVEENNAAEMSARELQAAIKEKQELESLLQQERERIKAEQMALEEERQQRADLQRDYEYETELRKKFQDDLIKAQEAAAKAPAQGTAESKAKAVDLRKAEKALSESQQRIAALEADMKAKEEELNAKVEAAVKEREKEMAEQARKREEEAAQQVAELQEQLRKNNNTAAIKVKLHFDALVGDFKELIGAVALLENEEQKKAISERLAALCDDMKAKL
ncbi:DUF3102 domain-containing protein [Paenibacillus sp. FSL R5-808]|jgi:myosin heavy subunit|uniref:DUF3102 domain-containing protein n=1 Tax=unclassified Paenibacillus TaxID=185978 RepID=UPI0003E270B2|nr:DUF3102 domain-containing protein [Paenibacillus sp. FSL R5-808]ETT32157.1 hypothetical protein C169_24145 [Paenibacillus sp. FSL R5-808]